MLGEKLKELRTQKNLSQNQLANILNVHKATISLYESGSRYPSYNILKATARYFVSAKYSCGFSNLLNPSIIVNEI